MSLAGICNRLQPCLNLSSDEMKNLKVAWEPGSPEAPPRVAAGGTKPEPDELLDHLRLSILPWNEGILETLSPKLLGGADSPGVWKAEDVVSCDRERKRERERETEGALFSGLWRKVILHVGYGACWGSAPGTDPCSISLPKGSRPEESRLQLSLF